MQTPRNLTQLKKFFAPGMEVRCLSNYYGPIPEAEQVGVVEKVQHNGVSFRRSNNQCSWLMWNQPAANYRFTETGFSYPLGGGKYTQVEYITLEKPEQPSPEPKPVKPNPNLFTGPEAYQKAMNKARHGHKDWVVYRDKSGQSVAEKATSEAYKRALLAIGTQGRFTVITGSNAQGRVVRWQGGIIRWNNAKYFEKHGANY